jgi:RecB family exonuclease
MDNNYIQGDIFNYTEEKKEKEPEHFETKPKKDFYFSYSKFSLYSECPLKYRFKYIDKIPEKPKAFFYLGRVVHSVLEFFYSRVPPPDITELINYLKTEWERIPFDQRGYATKEAENLDINKTINIIKNFYIKHKDNDKIPFLLEYKTFVPIDNIVANIIADKIEYEGNGKISIVDYKTGREGNRNNDQLYFYQKISEIDPQMIEKINKKYNENVKRVEVNKMVYYYVEKLKTVEFSRANDTEIERFWERVLMTVENIQSKKFEPKPTEKSCSWCDYKQVCPVYNDKKTNSLSELTTEFIKLKNNIEELEDKKKKIEKEIISMMGENNELYDTSLNLKFEKNMKYEFKSTDELVEILKANDLYEKVSRPTVRAVLELLKSDEIDNQIKDKIKKLSNISYQIVVKEEKQKE